LLVFDGGGCSPTPPPTTAFKNERVCSFLRAVIVLHYHHPPTSKTSIRARF
jgi:hypothetical protein